MVVVVVVYIHSGGSSSSSSIVVVLRSHFGSMHIQLHSYPLKPPAGGLIGWGWGRVGRGLTIATFVLKAEAVELLVEMQPEV